MIIVEIEEDKQFPIVITLNGPTMHRLTVNAAIELKGKLDKSIKEYRERID